MDEVTEKLRQRTTRTIVTVAIDGIGEVRLRCLAAAGVLQLGEVEDKNASARLLVALSVVDEHGQPVFASPDELSEMDWALFKELHRAAMKINKLDGASAEKNFEAPPSST